jgi:hypothetical protein
LPVNKLSDDSFLNQKKKVNEELRNPSQKILADSYKALRVIREKWSPFSGGKNCVKNEM